MEELWGCVEYLKIPFDTLWEMPVYLRKYWIERHNDKVKNEQAMNDKTSGKNASTINSDAINTYAKLEQSNQSRRN